MVKVIVLATRNHNNNSYVEKNDDKNERFQIQNNPMNVEYINSILPVVLKCDCINHHDKKIETQCKNKCGRIARHVNEMKFKTCKR